MNKNKKIKLARAIFLTAILLLVTYKAYMHNVLGGGSKGSPSIHALCPYGGLESFYNLVTTSSTVSKIFTGTILMFFMTILLAVLFRRVFCGIICPFGALQEFFAFIGKKIFKNRLEIPQPVDKHLRFLKYLVLAITAGAAWITGELWMSPYDPWAAYGHIFEGPSALFEEFPLGAPLLIFALVGSLVYDRFFCKYLCPMGAFLALVSKISPSRIKRDKNICIDCGICAQICPANIPVDRITEVKSSECINCQKCILSCPKEGALNTQFGQKKISPPALLVIVLLLFFGSIGIGKLFGYSDFLPEAIEEGQTIPIDDIKGYMTLQEASEHIEMPLEEIYERLSLDESVPPTTTFKELSELNPKLDTHTAKDLLKSE